MTMDEAGQGGGEGGALEGAVVGLGLHAVEPIAMTSHRGRWAGGGIKFRRQHVSVSLSVSVCVSGSWPGRVPVVDRSRSRSRSRGYSLAGRCAQLRYPRRFDGRPSLRFSFPSMSARTTALVLGGGAAMLLGAALWLAVSVCFSTGGRGGADAPGGRSHRRSRCRHSRLSRAAPPEHGPRCHPSEAVPAQSRPSSGGR